MILYKLALPKSRRLCYLLSKFLQNRFSDCKGFFAEGNTRDLANPCSHRVFLSKVTYVYSVTLVSVCGKTCADRVSGPFLMPENYPFNPAAPQKLKGFSRNDGRPPSTPVFTVLRAGASDVEAPAQLINFILCYHAVSKCYCGVPAFTTMLPCTCRHRQLTPPRPDERVHFSSRPQFDKIPLGCYPCAGERCLRGPVRWRHQMPSRPSPSEALLSIQPVALPCRRPVRGKSSGISLTHAFGAGTSPPVPHTPPELT